MISASIKQSEADSLRRHKNVGGLFTEPDREPYIYPKKLDYLGSGTLPLTVAPNSAEPGGPGPMAFERSYRL
jgi:hypothetical protein